MNANCLIVTSKIKELADRFPTETEQSILNLVGLWQEKNNKTIEEIPSDNELNDFIKELRKSQPKSEISLSTEGYRKGDPQRHPDVNYVFTENAEAYMVSQDLVTKEEDGIILPSIWLEYLLEFPYKGKPKLNVSDMNGTNQAGIRTDSKGNISPNAYGIVVKKYQQDANGRFVAAEGQFQDTEEDFKLFVSLNEDMFQRLSESKNTKIVFPTQMGLGKAALPKRFVEWLQSELSTRFGINSTIEKNQRADYDGYGLKLSSISMGSPVEEVENMLDEALSSSFNTPRITSVEEQQNANLLFDPKIRKDRVMLISRLFSNIITNSIVGENKEIKSSRVDIIKELTPKGVFDKVLEVFTSYVNDSEENRIQAELQDINRLKSSINYTEEEKLEIAKKKAAYKTVEFNKIINNFEILAEETIPYLALLENIIVDINHKAPKEGDQSSDPNVENSEYDKEENAKEGWMTHFRETSSYDSLSQQVKKVISQIPQTDKKGAILRDDLGFVRYLDSTYVHATLIDKLRNMVEPKDLIPLLQELIPTKPWVKKIINLVQKDDTLFSKFYQDFRKDFVSYWIQKKTLLPDGTYKVETVSLNEPEGIYYLLDSWRDNYISGVKLSDYSVYDEKGVITQENAERGLEEVQKLINLFNNKSTEEALQLLDNTETINSILELLNMLGIDIDSASLKLSLSNIKKVKGIKFTDPVILLLNNLHTIYDGIVKGKVQDKKDAFGEIIPGDLINTFGSAYSSIANIIAEVTDDAIESNIRENSKSYYAHTTPNYLGTILKKLKNVAKDKERFQAFIESEYKQYDWFYKNGKWLNDVIEQLVNSEEMRNKLDHKVLLNIDKVDYSDWDSLDYALGLLNEYWGEPEQGNSNKQYTWYYVPIMADAPTAEFIKLRKYVSGKEFDSQGNPRSYKDILLDKFVNLVNQEFYRINLVIERDEKYQKDPDSISLISNYDIVRDGKGNIVSLGGAEFKFLPALNNYLDSEGNLFIEGLQKVLDTGTAEEVDAYMKQAISDIMEQDFEVSYQKWHDIGVLDETPEGKYKYLTKFKQGQSSVNASLIKSLDKALELLQRQRTSAENAFVEKLRNNKPITDEETSNVLNNIKNQLIKTNNPAAIDLSKKLVLRNNAKEGLREYFWNSVFATSQIIQLTTTDLAYYKNLEDFAKRYKEIHAPAMRLNTEAVFNGEKIGREMESTIYLKDEEIVSSVLEDIADVVREKYKKGELSDYDAAYILSAYGYSNHTVTEPNGKVVKYTKINKVMVKTSLINVADAQAYRSLSSYRAILGMSGDWNEEMQAAYNNLRNGTWSRADFDVLWQPKKPFLYTQVGVESGIENTSKIKSAVQHKNSEFLLLAIHSLVAGNLGKPSKLRAINKFMEENNIDVVQFESTTKVGKQGVIDISKLTTEDEVISYLKEVTGISKGVRNPNVIHEVPYADYGFQQETPEHFVDYAALYGTQLRKLITADMPDDTIITINGKKLTKKEWLDLYNAVITENILQSFMEVKESFKDAKNVEKLLQEELRSNLRYSRDLIKACTLDNKGRFTIPLFDPVVSVQFQQLLNSVIKSRITKQKIKGGALVQVSSYGLSEELSIKFTGEGENKRIEYFECYMPAYSKEFLEPLMDPKTHVLDINKKDEKGNYIFPKELRESLGYRIPTEDKYSMVPLRIKGFLPQQSGSAIMLPAEITTIAGSDFDIDKLYVMLHEFEIIRYDYAKARRDYATENKAFEKVMALFTNSALAQTLLEEDPQEFKEWLAEHKDQYLLSTPVIKKIKYDFNKSPQQNSLQARNNLLLDMMRAVLTNEKIAYNVINPGGFAEHKTASHFMLVLDNYTEEELAKKLNVSKSKVLETLFSLSADEIEKLATSGRKKLNPLSPTTQVSLHQQNTVGGKMISVAAVHNAHHALMQHTNLEINEHGAFTLNGKTLTSLHSIKNKEGRTITRLVSGYLAAAVDNAKDPILANLNVNMFTADCVLLLARLGYTPLEIGLLMKQPIVLDITKEYNRQKRDGVKKDKIIENIIKEYGKKAQLMHEGSYENFKNNMFTSQILAKNILLSKEMSSITEASQTNDYDKLSYYKNQVSVGYLFAKVMKVADSLDLVVKATRADSTSGAAGPTIADTQLKIRKVTDLWETIETSEDFPLSGAEDIVKNLKIDGINLNDEQSIRKLLLDSKLPFSQAFFTLGLHYTQYLLQDYFPHYTKVFEQVLDVISKISKAQKLNVKTVNSVYNDFLAYVLTKIEFFGTDSNRTIEEKRSYYINEFPRKFQEIKESNPDIASLDFIKRIKLKRAGYKNPVDVLVFKNVGSLNSILKDRYMQDWEYLLYMDNPQARQLALDLFLYNFYRNGLSFNSETFSHLASVLVRTAVPGYIDTLYSLLDPNNHEAWIPFIHQYIYNHLDNRQLVPEIAKGATLPIIEDQQQSGERTFLTEFTFEYNNYSKEEDLSYVKSKKRVGNSYIYKYHNFIAFKDGKNYVYYKLVDEEGSKAYYVKINPLGSKNNFLEYEYNKDAEEIASMIKAPISNIEDPFDDSSKELTEDEQKVLNERFGDFANIDYGIFAQIYGDSPTPFVQEGEVLNGDFDPNWEDANGFPLCGIL
jgi:hypothetical protein